MKCHRDASKVGALALLAALWTSPVLASGSGGAASEGVRGRADLRELLRLSQEAWSHLGSSKRDSAEAPFPFSDSLDAFCEFTSLTPEVGGVVSGSGIGIGLSHSLFRDADTSLGWRALGTHKGYQEIGLFHGQRLDGAGRYRLQTEMRYRDLTQEGFYGLGMDSHAADRTSFRLTERLARSELRWDVSGSLRLSLTGGVRNVFTGDGRSSGHPSSAIFAGPGDIARFGESINYAGVGLGVQWDTRDRPSYARRGSLVRAGVAHFVSWSDAPSYQRFTVDLQHARPLPFHDHALAARLGGTFRAHPAGSELPFFLAQGLGGSRTLRGYALHRFRGADVVFATVEYRSRILRDRLDAVVFWDTGGAYAELGGLTVDSLRHSFGAGVRLLANEGVLLRLELARGDEGTRFLVSFSAPF